MSTDHLRVPQRDPSSGAPSPSISRTPSRRRPGSSQATPSTHSRSHASSSSQPAHRGSTTTSPRGGGAHTPTSINSAAPEMDQDTVDMWRAAIRRCSSSRGGSSSGRRGRSTDAESKGKEVYVPGVYTCTSSTSRGAPRLVMPPASWARFPSHLRAERNRPAAAGDGVDVRDFAARVDGWVTDVDADMARMRRRIIRLGAALRDLRRLIWPDIYE